ncbi:MAG: PAS domain-containing protein [Candidatus Marinimicrobia bacterium]|nr:PAS domain-containing protein [Candidatus Neomarinimicrobiota bacterium]
MFKTLGEGIVLLDPDHTILQANDAAARLVGYEKADDIIGEKCFHIFHNRDSECPLCTANNAIKAGKRVQTEKSYMKDRIWSVSSTPIYDNNGELLNVIEVLTDTTELHRKQHELLLNRERLNTAFDAARIGTFTVHFPEMRWVPDAQLKHLYDIRQTETEFSLDHWFELVDPEDRIKMRKEMDRRFKKKASTCKFEFRIPGKKWCC